MKKVTLLGDSIRQIGYGTKVPELLGEEYEVFQPEDNCRYVKYTLRMLFDFKAQIEGSDIIHWNNGLWDTCTNLYDDGKPFSNEEEYVENMLRVAKELKKLIGGKFLKAFEVVEKELPFVKKIFLFRLCTLADRLETVGEDNFGLVYNVFDETNSGEPKPAAITLAKYINGNNYDVSRLYKFAKK